MTSEGMSPADYAVLTGNRSNDGFGYNGLEWIIILFLFAMFNGGWGNNGNGQFGAGLFPWMNQSNQMSDGFRDQMLNTQMNGIQNSITSGFGDVQTALCGGFAGVNASIANAQNGIVQQMYGNQIANLQAFNGLTAQQADLKYTVATENCADRTQSMMNTRDIIENCNRNNQAVLDKLCQLELDGVKGQLAQAQRENVGLQNQLNMAALRESQTAQNAFIAQGLTNEVDALYNRLKNCPVPSQPVYGSQPIFTCGGNQGGCGCGFNA